MVATAGMVPMTKVFKQKTLNRKCIKRMAT